MQKPSYYSILTANVRYDSHLKPNEKLMYSEITALSNKYGYCTANNNYFANLYSKNKLTVSRWISDLKRLGYLKVQVTLNGKRVIGRRIYPIDKKINRGTDKKINAYIQKDQYPIDKKVKDNNTSNNNTRLIDTNNGKPNYRQMIVKDLESLMVNINTFVSQDIDNWLNTYDPKLIFKAIHQVGSTSPSPTWVTKDISTQLARGCKTYQPKRRSNNYGHQPIKEHVPDWAKDGYKPKLHHTNPKLQAKIRKQLRDLGYGKKNNK